MINRHNKRKWYIAIALTLLLALIVSGCGKKEPEVIDNEPPPLYSGETKYTNETNPVATIEMEDGNTIKIELYPQLAPNTVYSFISLAEKGFYDGLIFHRVIHNFMIQGGDPEGTGYGGPGYMIKGEFDAAGFPNDLSHERGVISMGRMGGILYDTAGSQFFIVHKDSPHLDGQYAAFGKVIAGIETVDQIAAVKTDGEDRPLEEQRMKQVTIETFGIDYPEPEIIVHE